jgi:enoyl-CoA hydratase/carnithine racemase
MTNASTCQLKHQTDETGIVTLRLSNPSRSMLVLDTWLIDQIHAFIEWLKTQPTPTGFILASDDPRVFLAGADLAEIARQDDAALHAYLTSGAHAFARITTLPFPSVACVHGAALGGGLEIALHCDGLVGRLPAAGARPWRVGLPEASLGLCPGWGGTQMLPARIDPAEAIRATAAGSTWAIDEAPAGLFDELVPPGGDLHAAAVRFIRSSPRAGASTVPECIGPENRDEVAAGLSAVRSMLPDTAAARAVVEAVEIGLSEGWPAAISAERRLLVGLRHTPDARSRLAAFFSRG